MNKKINRLKSDNDRCEPMHVEIMGGAGDGLWLVLDVVMEGPGEMRVLEKSYTNVIKPLLSSEVAEESFQI